MPMNFPDMNSLKDAAQVHKFRSIAIDESDKDYRKALAIHVLPIDRVEAYEILFGYGWDRWTDEEKMQSLSGRI